MNKIFYFLLGVILFTSCEKVDLSELTNSESSSVETTVKSRNIQFVIKGLDVSYSSRATVASEEMTDLYIWEGSTLLKHQVSTDTDFGTPTVALSVGTHDLTFVTSKSDGQGWSNGIWTCTKVKDTYGTVLTYTVSSSSSSKQVELTRVNGKLTYTIEDKIPAGASSAVISTTQCYGLDKDLNGINKGTVTSTLDISSVIGSSNVTLSTMIIPESHTDGMSITSNIKISGSSVICSYDTNATIKPNVITNIHGSFFSSSGSQFISLNTNWSETNSISLY